MSNRKRKPLGRSMNAGPVKLSEQHDTLAYEQQASAVAALKHEITDLQSEIEQLRSTNSQLLASGQQQITLSIPIYENDELIEMKAVKLEYLEYTRDEMLKYVGIAKENTRWGSTLNRRNLADLIEDFDAGIEQQWPGIGYGSRDSIKLLDGQRRFRAMEFSSNHDLKYKLYRIIDGDGSTLTSSELNFVVRTSKKVKENSKVELAFEWQRLLDKFGWDYQRLAEEKGVSAATVTRIMKAVKVPKQWYEMLPDIYSLSNSDIDKLAKACDGLTPSQLKDIKQVLMELSESDELSNSLTTDAFVARVIAGASKRSRELTQDPKAEKVVIEKIGLFLNSDAYAKRITKNRQHIVYDLNRLSADQFKRIDDFIRSVLE